MSEPVPPEDAALEGQPNVVPLGAEVADAPEPPPSPPASRLHGLAIAGMALCALLGIGSMLAFVTVRWAGAAGRFIIAVVIFSAIGFLVCASTAVFTAARDMYARAPGKSAGGEH
jgi:hypothetical protein